MIHPAVSSTWLDRIGDTPMIRVAKIFVKLECANPGGSVKDRIAHHMIRAAERRGDLVPGATIVETTSGNTGIALAMVGRELGYRVIVFMPEHMSIERRRMMQQLGAEVRLTPRVEGFEGAVRARDEYKGRQGFWVPDQFSNPDNTDCHRTTTGQEILQQLRSFHCKQLDYFVAGVGTGGTLMGVGQALREWMPNLKLVAVEPTESNALCGGPTGEHGIMGIGDGFVPDLVDRSLIDEVMTVSTAQALETTRQIRSYGYCVGISSGANMHVASQLRRRNAKVLTLWPDSSDRYASVGLAGLPKKGSRCGLRPYCLARSRALLE